LLLFAFAARRLKLSTLGFMQYFSPTIQLLLAITYFGEPFTRARQVTFAFIWAAVILFLIDQILASRRSLPVAAPADMET
jgi:chloramphenicol-sensitive protein RarD